MIARLVFAGLAAASLVGSFSLLALPSVEAAAASSAIEIATSDAAVDLQAMFDAKAKAAGAEGQTLAWLVPHSSFRLGSEADLYSDFRFLQAVPCHGDVYLYYYADASSAGLAAADPFLYADVSFADSVGADGLYHDSYAKVAFSQDPKDFRCFRKSVLRGAYSYSVGSSHRISISGLESSYGSYFSRSCGSFEICWTDVADGSDPIARSFSDDYVVVSRKLPVLDCVLVPNKGGFPESAFENFWCFFSLGESSLPITSLASLSSVRVSYLHSSYVASVHYPLFCDGKITGKGEVYGGLYKDDSDWLSYLGGGNYSDGPFLRYPSKAVSYVDYEDYRTDSLPIVVDVAASGVSVITAPDSGDAVNKWLFGHDDLVYSFKTIQKLDDASLDALQLQEDFQETEGARIKPFVSLCREFRGWSDADGSSGSYDYAILLNDRSYSRKVVSTGPSWGGNWTRTACDQIDSVRMLSLTFHDDLLGGDVSFSCVDTPSDTETSHVTVPYTVHVKGLSDYVVSAWDRFLTVLKAVFGVALAIALVWGVSLVFQYVSGAFAFLRARRSDRRLSRLERRKGGSRRR